MIKYDIDNKIWLRFTIKRSLTFIYTTAQGITLITQLEIGHIIIIIYGIAFNILLIIG